MAKTILLFWLLGLAAVPPAAAAEPAWEALFDGRTLEGWKGDSRGYKIEDGVLVCTVDGGTIFTEKEYADFVLSFEFKLTAGANNGIGIRYSGKGDPAYEGIEVQILDDAAKQYAEIKDWQAHGSLYGIVAAKRGHLKPAGEWNREIIRCKGDHVTVTLNGVVIVDARLASVKPANGGEHGGMKREKGHIALCGHKAHVEFRDLRVSAPSD